jgi:hypothetical protein
MEFNSHHRVQLDHEVVFVFPTKVPSLLPRYQFALNAVQSPESTPPADSMAGHLGWMQQAHQLAEVDQRLRVYLQQS